MVNVKDLAKPNLKDDLLSRLNKNKSISDKDIREEPQDETKKTNWCRKRNKKRMIKILKFCFWFLVIDLVIGIIGGSIYVYKYYKESTTYDGTYVLQKKLELDYWKCKAEIINEIEIWMNSKVKDHNLSAIVLLNACDKYNIDIRLVLSQGLKESHFGTAGLAKHTNSVWNQGAYDGHKLDQILKIHKFSHPNQSIEPYLALLRKSYLGNSKTERDLLDNFVTLKKRDRYASYPLYEKELKLIWEGIDQTTRLPELLQQYNFLKVELGR